MTKEPKHFVFVDGEKYPWDKSTITAAEIRTLAGVPEGAQVYLEVPGKPDVEVKPGDTIDLAQHKGPARFSTQSPGSQAG
jgi:hypothetical protein